MLNENQEILVYGGNNMNDSVYRSIMHEMLDELINLRLKIKEMEKHPANQEAVEKDIKKEKYAKCIENPTYVLLDDPINPVKILRKDTPVIVMNERRNVDKYLYIKIQYANNMFGWVRLNAIEFEPETECKTNG